MRGLITFLGAVAAVPLLVVACGGDSDDGGSTGGSGGGLLGGAGGMSGSGGSTGGTSGSGGATGGTGGGITNECSPIPSKTAGSGGTDGGGVDSGTDASSGGSPADASVDGAATDGGPAPDAGTDGAASDGAASDGAASDGAAGDGATSDGGGSDGGVPTIQCGSNSCSGVSLGGLLTVNPCCTTDGCGMNIDASVSGLIGIAPGCYGVGQAGKADTTCPMYTVANPLGGTIDFPGCCRPDGECGFAIDTSSFGGPNLGCVPQECNGGPAKTCTP